MVFQSSIFFSLNLYKNHHNPHKLLTCINRRKISRIDKIWHLKNHQIKAAQKVHDTNDVKALRHPLNLNFFLTRNLDLFTFKFAPKLLSRDLKVVVFR